MSAPTPPTPNVLVVAPNDDHARSIAAALGAEWQASVRVCTDPAQAGAEIAGQPTDVVIAALPSIAAAERFARSLRLNDPAPALVVACERGDAAEAALRVAGGSFADYVAQFPSPADPSRLATSVRIAARHAQALRAAAASARSGRPAGARARARVVVVEDDEVLHALVGAMLDPEAFELSFVTEGAAALDRIKSVEPDLVLMDVMLPDGDGVAITQQIKATADLAAIPVLMLTGEARMATLVRSMEAGATDFIVKPFTREALLAKVTKYLPQAA